MILNEKYNYIVIVSIIITYLSAYTNGKVTCKRYLINHLLYLLTSSLIIFVSLRYYDKVNIHLDNKIKILYIFTLLIVVYIFYKKIENNSYKHILWLIILIQFSYFIRMLYEKNEFNKILVNNVIHKLIIIFMICIGLGILFPNIFNTKYEILLLISLGLTLTYSLFDYLFLEEEYKNKVQYLLLFIFSAVIIIDLKDVIKESNRCIMLNKTPDYLKSILNIEIRMLNKISKLFIK